MSVTHLLDTDIIIDIQRKFAPALAWYANVDTSSIGVPGFVVLELIQNAGNRADAVAAQNITRLLPIVWPTKQALDTALSQFESLSLAHGVGIIDVLIAATALDIKATLYTTNLKHYRNFVGIVIAQPYQK